MKKTQELEGFVWPEFNSDKERIKFYTQKYKNSSIIEAFNDVYGTKCKNIPLANETPQDFKVGDKIKAMVSSVNKYDTILEVSNAKKPIVSKTNLWKFDKFKQFIPSQPIDMQVVEVKKDKIVVDPLGYLLGDYLNPIIKNPNIQRNINETKPIIVKNLSLTRGGFMGKAVIPNVSEFVGEEYTVDAFIPGSQIVLNVTDDFEKFNGADVCAFIVNYIQSPTNPSKMSLICSVKELIKFTGECNMVSIFKEWCENTRTWDNVKSHVWEGKVTGVINTSKKCGVFVEIPELSITGMVSTPASELVNYKPHQDVSIKLVGFEEETYFNEAAQQKQHVEPYVIEGDILEKCNLKPILEFA